jgi:hypothetical protein
MGWSVEENSRIHNSSLKIGIKSTQKKQVSRPTTGVNIKKRKLFEETPTPVSKSKKSHFPHKGPPEAWPNK